MNIPTTEYTSYRLVKSEDLNHHGTLFAGRAAEWFIESGFIAASKLTDPKFLVCAKIHGMTFEMPVKAGETVCYTSIVIYTGITSLTTYVEVRCTENDLIFVSGFITFVFVDKFTKPKAHNITVIPQNERDKKLMQQAKLIRKC